MYNQLQQGTFQCSSEQNHCTITCNQRTQILLIVTKNDNKMVKATLFAVISDTLSSLMYLSINQLGFLQWLE